ncbi:MAG: 6-bladed beta-propeller, partial [Calditrichaeota bacterium]|nr:6-bladed beta-propeller [Calditrichota bacterium]
MYYLLIFLLISLNYSDKKLSSKPKKENAIQLKELFTLKDKDGFYQRASASTSENGMTAVLDAGNKSIHVFDKNGKHLRVFGEEGNGPGELSRPFRIFTSKDRIYVREDMRVNCYDFTGKHIRDYSLMVAGSVGTPMIMDNHLAVSFRGNSKFLYVVFDDEGNQIEAVDNKTYEQP